MGAAREATSGGTRAGGAGSSNDGTCGSGGRSGASFYDAAQREWAAVADSSRPRSGKPQSKEPDDEADALRQIVRNALWVNGDCSSPHEPCVTMLIEYVQSWTRQLISKVRARRHLFRHHRPPDTPLTPRTHRGERPSCPRFVAPTFVPSTRANMRCTNGRAGLEPAKPRRWCTRA